MCQLLIAHLAVEPLDPRHLETLRACVVTSFAAPNPFLQLLAPPGGLCKEFIHSPHLLDLALLLLAPSDQRREEEEEEECPHLLQAMTLRRKDGSES